MHFSILLLLIVGNDSVFVNASPVPFSEEKLQEIDRLRAQGMSEVGHSFLPPEDHLLVYQFP